jgi:hypothetical protein
MREDAMKAIIFIIAALAVLVPVAALAEDLGMLRVTLVEGDAYILAEDSDEWFEASVNMPLREKDSLWVPEGGRMEVHVRGGAFVRLDGGTALDVLGAEVGPPSFHLGEGRLYLRNDGAGEIITVETRLATVRVPEGAVAIVEAPASGSATVSALRGHVYAETRKGTTVIEAGTYLSTEDGLYATVSRLPAPDEWERWNRSRDDDLSGPFASSRYLPEELNEYAYDFDRDGRWVYASDYGYVWTPSVAVSVGWAPYRHGSWRYVRGDYVWVSYERWGWVPYHYGRWTYVTRIGWCWVPPRHRYAYWSPGYVAWIYTPTYVAWVPLAPGEIYYGRGYYGPGSVNILSININIGKTVVKRDHRNFHVHDAVTVVNRDRFRRGDFTHVKADRDRFLKDRDWKVQGPPDIKPERRQGVAKSAGRDRLPGVKSDRPALERADGRRVPSVSKEPFELGRGRERPDVRADRPKPPEREIGRKSAAPRDDDRFARTPARPGTSGMASRGQSPPRPEAGAKRPEGARELLAPPGRLQREERGREAVRGRPGAERLNSARELEASRGVDAPGKGLGRTEPRSIGRDIPRRETGREAKAVARPEARDLKSYPPDRGIDSGRRAVRPPSARSEAPSARSAPPSARSGAPSLGRGSQGAAARGKQVEKPKAERREAPRGPEKSYGRDVEKSLPGGAPGAQKGKDGGPPAKGRGWFGLW